MNHLSLSKSKGEEHFPVIVPNLADRLQRLLDTKFAGLATEDPIRLDIEKFIALAKNSSFAAGVSDSMCDDSAPSTNQQE